MVYKLPSARGFGRALRGDNKVSASINQTNQMLDEVIERLDVIGAEIGAALNDAAREAKRRRKFRDDDPTT